MNAEEVRLREAAERRVHWKRWGPYVAERAWSTVREDYSATGDAWNFFPHEHARSRVYRWNEDGLAGICDRHQHICLALALWNARDPILKERLFGLTGTEGNHGEDVKECYYYLDSTPTHSYMKFLYKYPQAAFPYDQIVRENARRTRTDGEYELIDTGVFSENRYFDVFVEYAKATAEDILVRITVENRGPDAAPLHVVPTIWFRNRWSWEAGSQRPILSIGSSTAGTRVVSLDEPLYGRRYLYCEGSPKLLFTENETNAARLFGSTNAAPFVKDGINERVVGGREDAVNPAGSGTKAAAWYPATIPSHGSAVFQLRFTDTALAVPFGQLFEEIVERRRSEADEFYRGIVPESLGADAANVMRQALAGALWSKQYYHYIVRDWLNGDPAQPAPPESRRGGRNHEWIHVYNADVLSMPDKWEYPWYASWDLAFHCLALALVDVDFAKDQLVLMLREWYMHPNGQLPAYEWNFGNVNPPVHAWAALRVYRMERKRTGRGDRMFLERVFHKLTLNFTWWVNRKDTAGNNIFQGGFLGLDNIGVFDRSAPMSGGEFLEQSDATSWMAMYTLNLLAIAIELAAEEPSYEDIASKFWEHFLYIAHAMSDQGPQTLGLWDEADGFFYDVLHTGRGRVPIKVRSMVGLLPLLAVETLDLDVIARMPGFRRRMEWFIENRPDLTANIACMQTHGARPRRLLSIADYRQLRRILAVMLDEREFLSPHGLRALSKAHQDRPFTLDADGTASVVHYEPGESTTTLFGGNSNWRGPVWFPVNYLIIEALQRFHWYFGDGFKVECPTGSGRMMDLSQVAAELSRRLSSLFLRDPADGRRPVYGSNDLLQRDPHWRDLILFHEYFHGDSGAGLGASHQTGWTALVAKLLQQSGEKPRAQDDYNRERRAPTVTATG